MLEEPSLTEEEFEGWLDPQDSVKILAPRFGPDSAKEMIVLRLLSGEIRAVAKSVWNTQKADERYSYQLVTSKFWQRCTEQVHGGSAWRTGDFRVTIYDDTLIHRTNYVLCGVRFDPIAVRALIPKPVSPAGPTPPLTDSLQPDPKAQAPEKRSPVPAAYLEKWAELYKTVYTDKDVDTLDFAWKSAIGMFPNWSVARDRVHALLKGRKTGPRKKLPET